MSGPGPASEHQDDRDAVLFAQIINGIDARVVGVHGLVQSAGLHADALEGAVQHGAVDFFQRLFPFGGVEPGHAHETARKITQQADDVVVGDGPLEVAVAARDDAHRHPGGVHFLKHQFGGFLSDGRGLFHGKAFGELCGAGHVVVDADVQETPCRGPHTEIDDHLKTP